MKQDQRITRIAVGIDERDAADHAVKAGLLLAEAFDARLDLLHAVPIEVPRWIDKAFPRLPAITEKVLLAASNSRVGHLSHVFDEAHRGPVSDLLTVVPEKPSKAILDHAESNGVDLIILGGHRDRGAFHFGSTARTVLGRSKCPVWVQAEPLAKIKKILAAIDISPNSDLTLQMARELGSRLGATVMVFHSFVPPYFSYDDASVDLGAVPTFGFEGFKTAEKEHVKKMVADFDWRGVEVQTTFLDGNPAQGILDRQEFVDLIVMGTHGRTGLARAFLGSQAYNVIKEARVPVLVVPNPERQYPESEK